MNKKIQAPSEAISAFIDRLIEEKKFEKIDFETLKEIRNDLLERVEDRINAAILQKMPPEKIKEFNELLDSEDEERIHFFCQNNIFDLDRVIAKELIEFRNIYLAV